MDKQYKRYELHESNGVQYPFKARPYDDADYYYAQSRDGGKTWIIAFKGKVQKTITGTWQDAVDVLEELNAPIRPRMCYN